MATPDTRCSVVIKKSFSYRGGTRIWSNRYHFEGDLPPTPADWATLTDAIVAAEKTIYDSGTTIVEAIGYDFHSATSTNPHGDAVFTKSYSVVGTLTPGTGVTGTPGDCAAMVRYSTPARSTKNHPVYLFNYYHGVYAENTDPNSISTHQQSVIETYAGQWVTGFSDSVETHERCGPRGAVAIGQECDPFVRHRDFPN